MSDADQPEPPPDEDSTAATNADRQYFAERIREHRPWEQSTGPKTPAGKAQAAQNGKCRQKGVLSRSERQQQRRAIDEVAEVMQKLREELDKAWAGVAELKRRRWWCR